MKRIALLLLLSLFLVGCAKFPATGGSNNTRIVFTMTVDGVINPDRFYFVAIRWSKDSSPRGTGPVPVIAQPRLADPLPVPGKVGRIDHAPVRHESGVHEPRGLPDGRAHHGADPIGADDRIEVFLLAVLEVNTDDT